MDFTFAGNAMPKRAEYDGVCRLCARDGVREEDSSATVSSSSSSEGSAWTQVCRSQEVFHLWPSPSYAGPRLVAGVGPRPTVAVRLRESVQLIESMCVHCSSMAFLGFPHRFPAWRLAVRVCGVCVVSVCRCWCSCGCPAGPCAGVGPVGAFSGSVFRSGFRILAVFTGIGI